MSDQLFIVSDNKEDLDDRVSRALVLIENYNKEKKQW